MTDKIEFTAEQEAEIQKRLAAVQQLEQYRMSGSQGFRLAVNYLSGLTDQYDEKGNLIRQGTINPFVVQVMINEFDEFKRRFYPVPQQAPAAADKPDGQADNEPAEE